MKQVIHPVELLRDRKGIYGIGIAKYVEIDHPPSSILLRPDRLDGSCVIWGAIYQMITGGFRHGMFCHTSEERLRSVVHHEMLRRAGLPWPPSDGPDDQYPYWAKDK